MTRRPFSRPLIIPSDASSFRFGAEISGTRGERYWEWAGAGGTWGMVAVALLTVSRMMLGGFMGYSGGNTIRPW